MVPQDGKSVVAYSLAGSGIGMSVYCTAGPVVCSDVQRMVAYGSVRTM